MAICNIMKMHYFVKNLLYSQALIRQTKYVVMMTKEGSTKIVNFMTPRVVVLMLGCGHICHYSEYVLSSTLSIYSGSCARAWPYIKTYSENAFISLKIFFFTPRHKSDNLFI